MQTSRALTTRELADVLGVHRHTIRRALQTGRLDGWRPIRVNASLRFVPSNGTTDRSAGDTVDDVHISR